MAPSIAPPPAADTVPVNPTRGSRSSIRSASIRPPSGIVPASTIRVAYPKALTRNVTGPASASRAYPPSCPTTVSAPSWSETTRPPGTTVPSTPSRIVPATTPPVGSYRMTYSPVLMSLTRNSPRSSYGYTPQAPSNPPSPDGNVSYSPSTIGLEGWLTSISFSPRA